MTFASEGLIRESRVRRLLLHGPSCRLIWLGFEMHYLAHFVVCWIGRIQRRNPSLSTFDIGKELPMSLTTTVADLVELDGG